MPERVWYRSLYWRIALGYVALLAVLLLVQTGLSVWLTDRMWGARVRTPEQLAEIVAQDLSAQLAQEPQTDLDRYLGDRYGSGYRPFVVVLAGDKRTFSNRPTAIPGESRSRRANAAGSGAGRTEVVDRAASADREPRRTRGPRRWRWPHGVRREAAAVPGLRRRDGERDARRGRRGAVRAAAVVGRIARAGADADLGRHRDAGPGCRDHGARDFPPDAPAPAQSRRGGARARRRAHRRAGERVRR